MYPAVCADDVAHMAWFQRKRGIFEWFLHLPSFKVSEISTIGVGRAVGVLLGKSRECLCIAVDLRLELLQNLDGLLFGTCNFVLQ